MCRSVCVAYRRAAGVVAVVAAGIASSVGAQTWRPVAVQLPPEVPVSALSACVLESGAPGLRPGAAAGQTEAQCGVGGVLRCNVPGAEPLDVEMNEVCRAGGLTLIPARSVSVTPAGTTPLRVEWREWREQGSALLAMRQITGGVATPLPVAPTGRLLRTQRVGASPVTFVIPDAAAAPGDAALAVPVAGSGGELFLALSDRERKISAVTVRGPETRTVEIKDAPFVSIPGLRPGAYLLRFGTPDTPEGAPIEVTVELQKTTEVSPRLSAASSEIRLSGLVSYNGAPMPNQALEVVNTKTDQTETTMTDGRGRYSIVLPEEGEYTVKVVSTYDFGQAEATIKVGPGGTQLDVDVAGATVRLAFLVSGAPPQSDVEFIIEGPQRFSGIVTDFSKATDLFGIPLGTYTVRASMEPNYVSNAVPLVIDERPGIRSLSLDLTAQSATLKVLDAGGDGAAGARARAGTDILRSDGNGVFNVDRIAPGTTIIVRAPGMAPACVVLQAGIENIITLYSDVAPLRIQYEFTTVRVPPGRIRLKDSGACTVPLEDFEWRRITAGFEILNLPLNAEVKYEYGAQVIPLKAPGEPVIIR